MVVHDFAITLATEGVCSTEDLVNLTPLITNKKVAEGTLVDMTAEEIAAATVVDTAKLVDTIANELHAHMDETAKLYGYDTIASAISYADASAVTKFQQEGYAFRNWRSLVWEFCYTKLGEWQAGGTKYSAQELIDHVDFPALGLDPIS